jgi:hypothetical protein
MVYEGSLAETRDIRKIGACLSDDGMERCLGIPRVHSHAILYRMQLIKTYQISYRYSPRASQICSIRSIPMSLHDPPMYSSTEELYVLIQ